MYQYQGSPMTSSSRDIRGEDLFAGIAKFYPLRTHLYFGAYLALLSLFCVYIFANPFGYSTDRHEGETLDFKSKLDASIHTFFVVLSLVLSKAMRRGHKIQKRQGYIRLHSRLKPFVLIPPLVVILGECTLLALGVWIESPKFCLNDAIKCILGLEEVLLLIIFVHYARILVRHNKRKPPPDALTALQEMGSEDTPLLYAIDHGMGLDSVTDEQAELIRFLQLRTTQLSKQVLKLQARLDQGGGSGGAGVRGAGAGAANPARGGLSPEMTSGQHSSDLDHIVAARDREIRSLNGERDTLQKEVREGKKRLMDLDTENQQLLSTNQQHVAENARLRAIIREWSVRHAKLEAKLQDRS
ncbi:hypothetical protein HOP50_06g40810 [Chloropicon primus]|uniref:Uncharacterized protein n=1 Tax=Chloropicon primus TaxID=1764295 RepID=A0A5B8MND8_9CHLO|nr:hypothetical protein A3770_06p40720 [Chloropicon primus]UPR00765.1 hypothetical protein HOP50_06g40810 [Chloropicon primus]|mmetsp:Transcript_3299/g.9201  ORF Transcript_3299/g.9201 Transcript_3299/m.9201 type:complete len:356 (+) Transcript_3299:357-1424(+)|eukprot:QDZ21554.1 hypothetical protein A3770_06p40720 [Chloropicon primus]